MKILLVNDDGVYEEGIETLRSYLSRIGDVWVAAPDRNCSGVSHALTLQNPIRVRLLEERRWMVQGTPADCVHVALDHLMQAPPDLVVSGINHGANLGPDVFCSGTVAAAICAGLLGLPSIAVSLAMSLTQDTTLYFNTASAVTCSVINKHQKDLLTLREHPWILNINVPNIDERALRGIRYCSLGRRNKSEPTIATTDPRGSSIYWIGPLVETCSEEDDDFFAVQSHYASVTPLSTNLTHPFLLKKMKKNQDESRK